MSGPPAPFPRPEREPSTRSVPYGVMSFPDTTSPVLLPW